MVTGEKQNCCTTQTFLAPHQVAPSGVSIRGITFAGVFYGVQSLLQLLPALREPSAAAAPISLPALSVCATHRTHRAGHVSVPFMDMHHQQQHV